MDQQQWANPPPRFWFPNTILHWKVPELFGEMIDSWDVQEKSA